VFVVLQVDAEGYVVPGAFVQAIKYFYTEDSLKTIIERSAPDCISKGNAHAKGWYNAKQIYFQIFPQNVLPQMFQVPRIFCTKLPISIYRHH